MMHAEYCHAFVEILKFHAILTHMHTCTPSNWFLNSHEERTALNFKQTSGKILI